MQWYTDLCEWSRNKLGLYKKDRQFSKQTSSNTVLFSPLIIGSRSEMASIQSEQGTAI